MDGANGLSRSGEGTKQDVHWMKNITAYRRPHQRIVFIDEGWVTPDSFAVHFNSDYWWDDPPVRHGEGTNFSFADGHSDWRKWQGAWTVALGLQSIGTHNTTHRRPGDVLPDGTNVPKSTFDFLDIEFIQKGCWGELGYMPTRQ
jgi:prepilin-type processing-associated H-X9-DG protein